MAGAAASRTCIYVFIAIGVVLLVVLVILVMLPMCTSHPSHHHQKAFVPTGRVARLPASITRTVLRESAPGIDLLTNFMGPDECAHVIALAHSRAFKPSTVVCERTGRNVANPSRTSWTVFLDRAQDPIIAAIEDRAALVSGVPRANFECLQVVKYEHGQFYKAHHDYIKQTKGVSHLGQRVVTLFVYLNDLPQEETGGGTVFPEAGVRIKPQRGAAALWYNVRPDGRVEPRTLHSGEALAHPTSIKYGLNIWGRGRPQTQAAAA